MTAETAADVQLRPVDRQDFERGVLAGDRVDLRVVGVRSDASKNTPTSTFHRVR